MDIDAEAIRNRRLGDLLERHGPALEALSKTLGEFGADAAKVHEAHDRAFDLGNRVEDALKRLDEKVREVGDLPDRLKSAAEAADRKNSEVGEKLAALEELRAKLAEEVAALKAEREKPAESKSESAPQNGNVNDGQDRRAPNDPNRIADENLEDAADMAERTGSGEQPKPTPDAEPAKG